MSIIRTLIRTASLVLALAPLIALGADQSSEGQRCGEVFTWSAGDIAVAPGCSFAREFLPPLKHAFEQPLTEAQAQEILKLVNEMVLPVQAGREADEARDRRRRQAFATIERLLKEEIIPTVIRGGVPVAENDLLRWQGRLAKDASILAEAEGHFRRGEALYGRGLSDDAVPELRAAKDIAVKHLGYVEPEYEARFADIAVEPETRHEAGMAREATLIRYRTLAAANPDIYREKLAEALVKCAEVCFPEAYKQTGGGPLADNSRHYRCTRRR